MLLGRWTIFDGIEDVAGGSGFAEEVGKMIIATAKFDGFRGSYVMV